MKAGKRMLGIAALWLILPALLAGCVFALPPQYARTYTAALCDKMALLRETDGPRIVVIGASGAAFDTDSLLLETEFPGYSAVNLGLYAGLGTTVMLELALPDLREGDIVVFSPEVSEQTLSDWFDGETMWQASENDPGLLTRLDTGRWEALLADLPRYAARKAGFFLRGNAPDGDGVYARSSFNVKGDVLPELRPANRMPLGWDTAVPLRFDDAWPSDEFTGRVNRFSKACGQRGVRFFFRFCPMNRAALEAGEEAKAGAFEKKLRGMLDCQVIGTLGRALMGPGWFFDTNFHLNGAGAEMNTILLAEDLKAALGDTMPVVSERPDMPKMQAQHAVSGDDGDAVMFCYAWTGEGLAVVGLTEAGQARESLTVPAVYEGQPVLALARNALSGTEKLRTLTLQANIRTIEDGAFSGCTGLRDIILLQEDPALCAVGTGLLEGSAAVVTVPAARYGSYCTNYFWAVHADRLRPGNTDPAAINVAAPATPVPVRPAVVTRITYDGNGGELRSGAGTGLTRDVTFAHLRENTLQGTVWFRRQGYTLTGWNTSPDGSGTAAGLGSRIDPKEGPVLYAQWQPWNPDSDFDWTEENGGAAVTGYHGGSGCCVIPEEHAGLPVRAIRGGAFRGAEFSLLVLPPSLRGVEDGAFADCVIREMILYDSLETIGGDGFRRCELVTLRVNAAVSPAYSGSYYDTFQDKLDYLRTLRGRRKLILSSGSSGRYGYHSEMLAEAFPDLSPVNMGVYAYTNALPQLALMLPLTEEGDILLYAPEFDAVREQCCVSDALDRSFWAMMESNYDAAAALDMRRYSGVFDSFGEYLRVRAGMPRRGYEVSPANYDDDGRYYPFSTYNQFGDFILPRPNGETDERLRHNIADYTPDSFPPGTVEALNAALAPFVGKGVTVWFGYTPRNSASLTEKSTAEARAAFEEYLRETLSVPVISRLEDSLMPGRYFWLIDSHLSTEGARLRTEQVIEDLKKAIKELDQP